MHLSRYFVVLLLSKRQPPFSPLSPLFLKKIQNSKHYYHTISCKTSTCMCYWFQADSQAPEPHLPGMPSPRKIHGSFLNKAVSPNVKKSPLRPTEKVTRSPGATKKNLSINDLQKEVRKIWAEKYTVHLFYFCVHINKFIFLTSNRQWDI